MTDTINYGTQFQIKLISSLMTDTCFLKQISDVLHIKYFENNYIKLIVKEILNYFNKYKTKPTFDSIKTIFQRDEYKELYTGIIQIVIDSEINSNSSDIQFVKDETVKFCKHQEIKKAILQSVDLLNLSNFDAIEKLMSSSFKIGLDIADGIDIKTDIDRVMLDTQRNPISLPWNHINNITDGGLGLGELGIIAAPPGIGKSWVLLNIAVHAARQGKKVVYFTMELYEDYVAKRFYANISNTSLNDLKYELDNIKHNIKVLEGEIHIKFYPTKSASINTLKSYIDKLNNDGFKPDLIIVDYADILKPVSTNMDRRDDQILGDIYGDLRGMAGEYKIPIWSASQINREGAKSKIIEGNTIAGSFEKLMIADLVISISRQLEDKLSNNSRWHVIKNRFGLDGITFNAMNDLSKGKMVLFDSDTTKAKEMEENTSITAKKYLKSRYEDLMKHTL